MIKSISKYVLNLGMFVSRLAMHCNMYVERRKHNMQEVNVSSSECMYN